MIVLDCPQLSDEWFTAKIGIPSASHAKEILRVDGKPSKSAIVYARKLAHEIVTGKKLDTYQSFDMQRGIENEPTARSLYEYLYDVEVKQVGLCYRDDKKLFSCSPDGLIGDDGGIEIKDAKPEIFQERLENGWKLSEHFQQIQSSLWATGRTWWNRVCHCDGIIGLIVDRYYRDDKWCAAFAVEVDTLWEMIHERVVRLRAMA